MRDSERKPGLPTVASAQQTLLHALSQLIVVIRQTQGSAAHLQCILVFRTALQASVLFLRH